MEDANARRERLKALKEAAKAAGQVDDGQPQQDTAQQEEEAAPVLKFRNYVVHDQKHIEHEKVQPAQPPKFEEPVVETRPEDVAEAELLLNVAPKKANWDLKRDIQPKLDKLERRTQRALVEILQEEERQRLQQEGVQD